MIDLAAIFLAHESIVYNCLETIERGTRAQEK